MGDGFDIEAALGLVRRDEAARRRQVVASQYGPPAPEESASTRDLARRDAERRYGPPAPQEGPADPVVASWLEGEPLAGTFRARLSTGQPAPSPEEWGEIERAGYRPVKDEPFDIDKAVMQPPSLHGMKRVKENLRAMGRVVTGMAADVAVAPVALLQQAVPVDGSLTRAGKAELQAAQQGVISGIHGAIEDVVPHSTEPFTRPPEMTTLEGLTSAASFALPAVAGAKALSLGTRGAAELVAGLGATQGFGQQYFSALSAGAGKDKAMLSGIVGALGGYTEKYGVETLATSRLLDGELGRLAKALSRADRETGGAIERTVLREMGAVAGGAASEAAQNATQEAINTVAQAIYQEPEDVLHRWQSAFTQGGVVGGIVEGAVSVALGIKKALGARAIARDQDDAAEPELGQMSQRARSQAAERPVVTVPLSEASRTHMAEARKAAARLDVTGAIPADEQLVEVEPSRPDQVFAREWMNQRGTKAVFVQNTGGQALPFRGVTIGDTVYFDAGMSPDEVRRQTVYHEGVHTLDGEVRTGLIGSIRSADPEGFARIQRAHPKAFDPDLSAEEAAAEQAEAIVSWIDEAYSSPERIAQIAEYNPGIFRRFLNHMKRVLRRMGLKNLSTDLEQMLGTDLKADDPKAAAQMALAFKQAFDTMLARETVTQAHVAAPAQAATPVVESQAAPAVTQAPVENVENAQTVHLPSTETGQAQAQTEPSRPPKKRGGRQGELVLPSGKALPVTYRVVDAREIVPSHDPTKGYARNAGGDINERDYGHPVEGRAYRDTVERIALNVRPGLVLSDTPSASDGPPIVGPGLRVLGGNARSMGLQLAYDKGGEGAARLREATLDAAERFGLNPEELAGIERPVLVRELSEKDAGAPGEMSRILNQPLTTAKTANTEAVSRGSKIDSDSAAEIGEIIGDGTLREAMGDGPATVKLLRVLVNAGAFTDADLTALMNQSGLLTQSGRDIVEQTLMGSVVTNLATLSDLPPAIRQMILKSLPNLIRTRVAWPEFGRIMQNALEAVIAARASNGSLRKARSQSQMIGDVEWKTDEQAIALAERMLSDNQTEFARRIFVLVEGITDAQRGQAGFFDAPKRRLSKPEAFQEAVSVETGKREPGVPPGDGDGSKGDKDAGASEVGPRFAAAYHGSPHDFDKFTTEKIGTGEGAQAYGWGMYFAGNKAIAEHYRKTLAGEPKYRQIIVDGVSEKDIFSDPNKSLVEPGLHDLIYYMRIYKDPQRGIDEAKRVSQDAREYASKHRVEVTGDIQPGRLYQVALAPAEDEYLLWDKPLREQSEKVKAVIENTDVYRDLLAAHDAGKMHHPDTFTGSAFYTRLAEHLGGQGKASAALRSGGAAYPGSQAGLRRSPADGSSDTIASGIRGIKYLDASSRSEGEGSYNYVIFDDADVTIEAKFALKPLGPKQQSTLPERTRMTRAIEALADRMEYFRQVMTELGETEIVIDETLLPGRIQHEGDYAVQHFIRPIERLARRAGLPINVSEAGGRISVDDFRRYLAANKVNAAFVGVEHLDPDTGAKVKYKTETNPASGRDSLGKQITNSYALSQINRAMNGPRGAVYGRIAELVRDMNEWKLNGIVASGRQTKEWKDAVIAKWGDFWSPARDDVDLDAKSWASSGLALSVRGPAYKPKKGRRTVSGSPMALSVTDIAHQVAANERNIVTQKLEGAFKRHPSLGEVQYIDDQATASINRIQELTDMIAVLPDDERVPEWKKERADLWQKTMARPYIDSDLWVFYRVEGKNRALVFADDALARAAKGKDIEQINAMLEMVGLYSAFHRKTIIDWNPFFAIGNLPRDVQTALSNVYLLHGSKMAKAVAKNLHGAYQVVRQLQFPTAERAAMISKKYAKEQAYLREWREAGGSVSRVEWDEITKALTNLESRGVLDRGLGALAEMTPSQLKSVATTIGHLVEASEQISRVATYIAARDAGMGVKDAAVLSRQATVDWGRKGNWNPWLTKLFTFAPASAKGVKNTIDVWKKAWNTEHGRRRLEKLAGGMFSFGFTLGVLSRMFAPDEYEGESDWSKATRAGLWLGKYSIGFPLAWGYNVFFYAGMLTADTMFGSETPLSAATKLAAASMDAFSPISKPDAGYAPSVEDVLMSWTVGLTPDIARPVVETVTNVTYTGAPVSPKEYDETQPAHMRYWASTNPLAVAAAAFISSVTGGSDNVKGAVEMSPSSIQHLFRSYTGQVGTNILRIMEAAVNTWHGEPTSPNEIPGVNRFLRSSSPAGWSQAYYEAKHDIAQAVGMRKDRRAGDEEYRVARLERLAKRLDDQIAMLRKRRDTAVTRKERRDMVELITERQKVLVNAVRSARGGK